MGGPIGWQVSPNGPAHLNECIPCEPEKDKTLWVEDEPFTAPKGEEEDVEWTLYNEHRAPRKTSGQFNFEANQTIPLAIGTS